MSVENLSCWAKTSHILRQKAAAPPPPPHPPLKEPKSQELVQPPVFLSLKVGISGIFLLFSAFWDAKLPRNTPTWIVDILLIISGLPLRVLPEFAGQLNWQHVVWWDLYLPPFFICVSFLFGAVSFCYLHLFQFYFQMFVVVVVVCLF